MFVSKQESSRDGCTYEADPRQVPAAITQQFRFASIADGKAKGSLQPFHTPTSIFDDGRFASAIFTRRDDALQTEVPGR